MKILVTGAAGYIGSHLSHRLKAAGHYVVGLDRIKVQDGPYDQFIVSDLLEKDNYRHLLKGIDCVCHLAAAKGDWGISAEEYYRDNTLATRSLIESAEPHRIKNWVFYSTVSVLGPSDTPLPEDAPRQPINPYGATKASCELAFDELAKRQPDFHILTIRPSVVFGPKNPWNTNIFRLIDAIHKKRFIMIGRGKDIKTTSFITNLIDAHMFLMDHKMTRESNGHEIFHYVDQKSDTTDTIVNRIYSALKIKRSRFFLPLYIAAPIALIGDILSVLFKRDLPITSARVRKFCTSTNFDASSIRKLGFEQKVTNQEAIESTVFWYLKEYKK